VVAQVIRHNPRVCIGFFHADAQRFERPAEHPAGMHGGSYCSTRTRCHDEDHNQRREFALGKMFGQTPCPRAALITSVTARLAG
jgi:hypothetical protein